MAEHPPAWRAAAAADTVRLVLDVLPRFYRTVASDLAARTEESILPARTLYRLLGIVDQTPGLGLTELAGRLGITKTNASPLVEKLVARGWLIRSVDPEDRRHQRLNLTDEGRRQFHEGWDRLTGAVEQKLAALDGADARQLAEALRVVAKFMPQVVGASSSS